MNHELKRIVIIGGGTAGWLTAGILAAQLRVEIQKKQIEIELIESSDIATVGVGEGTWPSMRSTLQKIGVSEFEFIRQCDVSFKQGSKFVNWLEGSGESYYHPFSLPESYAELNLAYAWQIEDKLKSSFAHMVCPQSFICDNHLAPKQIRTPEYAFNLNYGYHLNAGKFAVFLRNHCVEKLGVKHRLDKIIAVENDAAGFIRELKTESGVALGGDLFVDCSGFAALLIGKHYEVPFISKRDILFNDSAIAVQVPYEEESAAIASCTVSTAQKDGWVWDIGLPTRRGVGFTYASEYASLDEAEKTLLTYLSKSSDSNVKHSTKFNALNIKKIEFNPGYRKEFWHKNCVAIGISAGFLEPLEASALVLIERSAQMLVDQLPLQRDMMPVLAKRFNQALNYHWQKIIDFLKLHYVLSRRRDSDYWIRHIDQNTQTETLKDALSLWRFQPPWKYDTHRIDELFPSASYQYVLFGMNFLTQYSLVGVEREDYGAKSQRIIKASQEKVHQLKQGLQSNREILNSIAHMG